MELKDLFCLEEPESVSLAELYRMDFDDNIERRVLLGHQDLFNSNVNIN